MKLKFIFCCALALFFSRPLFAQTRVVDNAGLLGSDEKTFLENRIALIAQNYNFDLVIVTERYEGADDPELYADNFFDYNGYGYGTERDGCLFLQITSTRDMWFSTSGKGDKILNGTAYGKLEADAVKFLKENRQFEAYDSFLENWEEFLSLDAVGRSYNFFMRWNALVVAICWAIAFAIAIMVLLSWKGKMDTALAQTNANAYTVPGSLVFKLKTDRFLFSTVTTTKREPSQNSSGGGKGGIHTGSSGSSHGGGGRKY